MRIYQVGEIVRLADESLATVKQVIPGPYRLPEGQAIGGVAREMGGECSYVVENEDGEMLEVRDRDVRNPPKQTAQPQAKKSAKPEPKKKK